MDVPDDYSSIRPTAFPSENSARAVLLMEHVWPELADYVEIVVLAERYGFDYITLEIAAQELHEIGLLERKDIRVTRKLFFLFPFEMKIPTYRRKV